MSVKAIREPVNTDLKKYDPDKELDDLFEQLNTTFLQTSKKTRNLCKVDLRVAQSEIDPLSKARVDRVQPYGKCTNKLLIASAVSIAALAFYYIKTIG